MSPFTSYPLTKLDAAGISESKSSEQGYYDYIVVGGGTAGCVLASCLSEDPGVKVLLLERGNARRGWTTRVPLLSTNFLGDEDAAYTWSFTPLTNLTNNPRLTMVTGMGLWRWFVNHSMAYRRGYPQDYDLWSACGRKGWSYKEIEGYFKKSKRFAGTPERNHHGAHGERIVRDTGDLYFPSAHGCVDACTSLGLPYSLHMNAPETSMNVCGKLDFTIDLSSHRNSTFHAFLPQKVASERKSQLHLCTRAAVTALDVDGDPNYPSVSGVSFRAAERTKRHTMLVLSAR
ncbi:hypothetical protein H2248_011921 [Termitomyces sp. 'cryptogamus']|nr:hypothetical protein H2248_011921 [Termitomyces sp. 'cryptogamus']